MPTVACPKCRQRLIVPQPFPADGVRCPACGHVIRPHGDAAAIPFLPQPHRPPPPRPADDPPRRPSWDHGLRLALWFCCAGGAVLVCLVHLATKTDNVMQQAALAADTASWLVGGYVFCRAVDRALVLMAGRGR